MKDITAVVLAGGSGSRFWPLTTNKIIFPFFGKSFIHHSVAKTLPDEVHDVAVVANEKNRLVLSEIDFGKPTTLVIQDGARGMADAVLTAKDHLLGKSLLILIADDLFEPELLHKIVERATQSDMFALLPGRKTESYFHGGYLKIAGDNVMGIVEKPGEGNTPSDYVTISGHFIRESEALIAALEHTTSDYDDVYEVALNSLMATREFRFFPYTGRFHSLNYPWDVLGCMDVLNSQVVRSHQGSNVDIKSNVVIEGDVYIGDNVKIFENTKITGPVWIGDNTIIGNNNIIRHSSIGHGCVTGFSTDITRSYIGNDCWFHTNYIGDSVIENNVSMGSGTVLANLRLDEGEITTHIKAASQKDFYTSLKEDAAHMAVTPNNRDGYLATSPKGEKRNTKRNKFGAAIGSNVRIGVNASIMPGIKIGSGSFVGAGLTVYKDIPENSFAHIKPDMVIAENTTDIRLTDRSNYKSGLK